MFTLPLASLLGAATLARAAQLVTDPATTCQSFASSLSVPDATINIVEYVPAGTNLTFSSDKDFNSTGDAATCLYTAGQVVPVDLCRVNMWVATSNRSGINMETWLPTNWTGRFLSTGNGGIGGCIQYEDLAYTAGLGFATVGANNGHNGTGGIEFYENSDVVEDFAYRSLHTGVVVGKEVTEQYYGEAYSKSYYLGCSTGGREGFKMVQDFPLDFDGVVAGAPALDFTGLTSWSGSFYSYFGDAGDDTYIPAGEDWTVIHQEILNQCDALDGVVDGIIEDPLVCHFDSSALLCPSSSNTTCFSAAQVGALNSTFSDFVGEDGELIYPRMQPGSEALAQFIYYTTGPFPYSTDWFRYVVMNDTTFNYTGSIVDAQVAIDQNPFNIKTWNGGLSPFQSAGGKLLHYHGLADFIITSDNSPRYYEHVLQTMNTTSAELDDFYRFFRISGTGHCSGGDGAHMIGQTSAEMTDLNPQNNVLMRMVEWVENGNAPETVTGTKYVNDDVTQGVAFVRDHCKYPTSNHCVDPANYTLPEAWECM